jgi:predicted transcriptional regulator
MLHSHPSLSRRERQILDVLYRLGQATAQQVLAALPDSPSYSAVRTHLRILEEKGHIRHSEDGPRYLFHPAVEPETARRSALTHLLNTFFDGSPARAAAALLDDGAAKLSTEELDRLQALINKARQEGPTQ